MSTLKGRLQKTDFLATNLTLKCLLHCLHFFLKTKIICLAMEPLGRH